MEHTGLDVELENAANACVLAEVWFDRVHECRNLVVVTVSEGIGTGILANGALVRGLNGMAGEFGHVPVDPAGPVCGCGSRGCWEVFRFERRGSALLPRFRLTGQRPSPFVDLHEPSRSGRYAKPLKRWKPWLNTWAAGCA